MLAVLEIAVFCLCIAGTVMASNKQRNYDDN